MRGLDFSRYALTSCVAAAMLTGCGGSQPPIGAPFSSSATRITKERPRTSVTYRALYSFRGSADGESPEAALAEVGGSLYGTTYLGGLQHCVHKRSFCGTTFAITTSGAETQLYSFRGPKRKDGANPLAGLIDVDGTFYGTTEFGGGGAHTLGTVYSITPSGAEAVLYRFNGGRRDGALPYAGPNRSQRNALRNDLCGRAGRWNGLLDHDVRHRNCTPHLRQGRRLTAACGSPQRQGHALRHNRCRR